MINFLSLYRTVVLYFFSVVFLSLFQYSIFKMTNWFISMKGIEQFRQALEISPKSVSAHYGLASGLLSLSKECTNLGAFSWGTSLLEVTLAVS